MISILRAAPRVGRRGPISTVASLLLAAAVIGTAACGGSDDDSSTSPTKGPAGVYSLQAVDRKALPVEVYRGSYDHNDDARSYKDFRVTVTGGTIQLDNTGAYHTTLTYEAFKDGIQETSALRAWGTYTVKGNRIFFTRDNGTDTGEGTFENGSVTMMMDIIDQDTSNKAYLFTK